MPSLSRFSSFSFLFYSIRVGLLGILFTATHASPITTSWFTELSGQYARIYPDLETEVANISSTSWDHPTGSDQLSPTYAGVHEISVTDTDLYIRTSGLAFHIMGPWFGGRGDIFNNYPGNTVRSARFPLVPVVDTIPRTITGGGAIGYLIDGVTMFDSRDGFSYQNGVALDAGPATAPIRGDGVWNRDAFINEAVTFDGSNSHPLTELLHYHAQPKGLRHLVNDSVDYEATTNTYTEAPNGTHSALLGWNFDGFPFYGPYGYSNPTDPDSGVRRMISGFQRRDGSNGSVDLLATGRTSIPEWITRNEPGVRTNPLTTSQYGPAVNSSAGPETFILGHYIEDNAYKGDLTGLTHYDETVANNRPFNSATDYDLNEYNVRWCVTPEFPEGTWAYFMCIDEEGLALFPYTMSRYHFGVVSGADEVTVPNNSEVIFEGGPEAPLAMQAPQVNPTSGDVTLTWSGVEGGTYVVENSDDLSTWNVFSDDSRSDQGTLASEIDRGRKTTDPKHFYRSSMASLAPFDDRGFNYDAPINPTFSATFGDLPPLNQIDTITVGGVTATILGRDRNTLFLEFDDSALAPGDYPIIITSTQGGTQTQSTNTYTVLPPRNVLLMIVDDWGVDSSPLDDLQLAGNTYPDMPNLQFLADNGLSFTNAYSQPVCAPTRASIITGRHGFRNGVGHPNGSGTLPSEELTLPEIFTAENSPYQLASFGKWHLGGGDNGPATLGGWPEFRGYLTNIPDYFNWSKVENGVTTDNYTTYTTTDQVDDTVNFINTQTEPWFVWLAFSAPHTPYHNPPSDLHDYPVFPINNNNGSVTGADQRPAYEASLQALDTEIGRLLETVDLTTTNVILIGDNGTPGGVIQAPYSQDHSKDTLYEGGVRVPMIAVGPDVTRRGKSTKIVHCVDIFSTVLDLANIDIPSATSSVDVIDSQSLLPVFSGTDVAERSIVAERHTTNIGEVGRTIRLASHPDYKLIIFGDPTSAADTSTYEMYRITDDINEQTPLTIPAVIGDDHYLAYTALIAKDEDLGPVALPGNIYLELPATTGSQSVPGQGGIVPTSITIDGVEATFISRVDPTETVDRYWVKCSLPTDAGAPYTQAIVTFPPNDNANQGDRIFTAINIVTLDE